MWNVYSADQIHVASYSTQAAAAAHVAAWPAASYRFLQSPLAPTDLSGGSAGTPSDSTETSVPSTRGKHEHR